MEDKNKTFIVMGMHRSATSLVAKALHKLGVHMGTNLLTGLHDNPGGHFEDMDFVQLNMKMLSGDKWKKPENPIKSLPDKVIELIKRKNKRKLWGWKDPRTSLTIKEYYNHLDDPIIVAMFRKPEMVGKSLANRGDMPEDKGKQLAKEYNKRIINFLEEKFT